MFLLSSFCGYVPNLFFSRAVSCSSSYYSNHYMTLGLTPAASQDDIKKAYFELCKKYHPDKNDGSAESTKMFRLITEAYEILGNQKSRKLYDQKMSYGGATNTQRWNVQRPEDYSYEAERFFYERRNINRMHMGKTQHYDFEAWTNAHYPKMKGQDFESLRDRRRNWRHVNNKNSHSRSRRSSSIFILQVIALITLSSIIAVMPVLHYSGLGISYEPPPKKVDNVKPSIQKQDLSQQEP